MARAILLGPVAPPKTGRLRGLRPAKGDLVIGIDAGAVAWKGIKPHIAIGDFDGLTRVRGGKKALRGLPAIALRRNKDHSDLHYALAFAEAAGVSELLCVGVTGGERLDHHLAALYELAESSASGKFRRVRALDRACEYYFVSRATGPLRLSGVRKGRTVSILPIGGAAHGVRLRGFRYDLGGRSGTLPVSSRGLSNVAVSSRCEVSVRSGKLVVVVDMRRR